MYNEIMTTLPLAEYIKQDNLEDFIKQNTSWTEKVANIVHYANIQNDITKSIHETNCDALQYAVHCNADKIFYHLLTKASVNPYGENYGWPLLIMALHNNRYDYAKAIINHADFDYSLRAHINGISSFYNKPDAQKHIDLTFEYLYKHITYEDITQSLHLKYKLVALLSYSEEIYKKTNEFYISLCHDKHESDILNIYRQDSLHMLARQVFNKQYKGVVADKLTTKDIHQILEYDLNEQNSFLAVFVNNEDPVPGIKVLLKAPDLLKKCFNKYTVLLPYLTTPALIILEQNGIDVWKENTEKISAIDYLLYDDQLDENTLYYLDNFTDKVKKRQQELITKGYKNSPNITAYLLSKDLSKNLVEKTTQKKSKI